MTLDVQFQTFFAMMIAGSMIAVQLDVYQRCLPDKARSKWPQAFLDLCFWIVQAMLVFYVLYIMNDGDFRFYIFLAIILGFFVYWQTVRPLFLRLLEVILKVVDHIYRIVLKIFYLFLLIPVVWLYKGVKQLLIIIYKCFRLLFDPFVSLLRFLLRPLYQAVGGERVVAFVKRLWRRVFPKKDEEDKQ
ncbi:spore cortex biosynthesis protein YabQ [Geomicrobium halophilum]|uniref:Spore cortex biosynthesis protein YabQ n=1 Tax=Geomicrobium halophilum TaxID=549000 RepID=A0A841PRX7_9BACL|nr:spore cortex biosynthesis protein YabQ [Geomicrobium halophilum]